MLIQSLLMEVSFFITIYVPFVEIFPPMKADTGDWLLTCTPGFPLLLQYQLSATVRQLLGFWKQPLIDKEY